MTSDGDSVIDKIKSKAAAAKEKVKSLGDESVAEEDIDYEPAPDQEITSDGMVVLSRSQVEDRDADGATGDGDSRTDS